MADVFPGSNNMKVKKSKRWRSMKKGMIMMPLGLPMSPPISAWEIGLKCRRKQLILPEPLNSWWTRVLKEDDLTETSLAANDGILSTTLPSVHEDPTDRFLIAIAQKNRLTLLTPDPVIQTYPDVHTLW
jgi:PIN domain nuclease of toxin-antitoxin system